MAALLSNNRLRRNISMTIKSSELLPKHPLLFPLVTYFPQLLHSGRRRIHGHSTHNQRIPNMLLHPMVNNLMVHLLMATYLKSLRCSPQLAPCQILHFRHLVQPRHFGFHWLISVPDITSLILTNKSLRSLSMNLATRWWSLWMRRNGSME